jgi:hypothetical protein
LNGNWQKKKDKSKEKKINGKRKDKEQIKCGKKDLMQ